ncbi:hypothetical protein J6590_093536 [Homalodisca vitripennis]|nr:hypothetical protein J6590_093536 [Homalodisca vitripennis]
MNPMIFLMDIATTGNISIDPNTIQNISGLLDHIENEDEEQYNVNDESKICRNNCEEKIVEKIQEKKPMSGVDGYLEDLTNKLGDSDDQMEIEDTQTDDYQPNESDLEEDRDDRILENDPQLKTRKKRHQADILPPNLGKLQHEVFMS